MRDENSGGNDLLAAREIPRVYHVVPTRVLDLEFLERRRSPNERAVARRRTARRFSLSGDIARFVESLCQNSQDALLQPLFHITPETCHNISNETANQRAPCRPSSQEMTSGCVEYYGFF